MDLDRFKDINDTYGHQAGDVLLKDVRGSGKPVPSRTNGEERLVIRFGGDEFLILACGTAPEDFRNELARAYEQMRKVCYLNKDVAIPFGITFGVASSSELKNGFDWEALFALADQRLYQGKERR